MKTIEATNFIEQIINDDIENGKISTCGRCIDVPNLCDECGYFFVAEYTLLFRGNPKIILEMLTTYLRYI